MNTMPRTLSRKTIVFKNTLNPSCIDLFIINSPLRFQNTVAVSNGLSDFHKMVIAVMKMSFKRHSPIERHYRNYKYINQTNLKNNLIKKLSEGISKYESYATTFIEMLNKYALLRKKLLRFNHPPYITKALMKAIMCTSQLETKYFKTKTHTTLKLYKKYENFRSKL